MNPGIPLAFIRPPEALAPGAPRWAVDTVGGRPIHHGKHFGKGQLWQKAGEVVELKHHRQINASAGAKWAKKLVFWVWGCPTGAALEKMSQKIVLSNFLFSPVKANHRGARKCQE